MTEEFVPFTAFLEFDSRGAQEGKLIFQKDNPSDMRELDDSLEIPIRFAPTETMTVKVFFGNDNDVDLCSEMYARERTITRTQAVGKRAIEELLVGPTREEKDSGYFTSINPDVKLQKITIQNGTAYADFDEQLERAVGGSCRVTAIRAQITETLKQFPTVENVVISIDGRTEDILQP
ncbi:MAG: GerMN domain-containing protein, partial [Candidatus Moranbacteria bacterium]|nr:GerMN domain-containing protein [Candidatus Moranbacteria bacterium]